jgi:hypothetical protein
VLAHLDAAQKNLRERAPAKPEATQIESPAGVAAWAAHFARESTALRRVLSHVRTNCAAFAPGTHAWCADPKRAQSVRLRLPAVPGVSPAESLNAWLSFLATQLDPAVPLLGFHPQDAAWLDVIVGEPSQADLVVLRSLPAANPIVSDIPYQLEAQPSEFEARMLAELGRGALPGASCFNDLPFAINRDAAMKWLSKFRANFLTRWLRSTGSPF